MLACAPTPFVSSTAGAVSQRTLSSPRASPREGSAATKAACAAADGGGGGLPAARNSSQWADWLDVDYLRGRKYAPHFVAVHLAALAVGGDAARALGEAGDAALFDASAAHKMASFRAGWEAKHGAAARKEAALDAAVPPTGPTWTSAAPREWRVLHLAQPAPPAAS